MTNCRAFIRCVPFILAMFLAASVLPAAGADNKKAGNGHEEKAVDTKPLFREHIVVTAVMSPKELKNCSDSLLLLTQPDLKFVSAPNAMSALGGLPGLFVGRSGDFGRNVSFGLRWQR